MRIGGLGLIDGDPGPNLVNISMYRSSGVSKTTPRPFRHRFWAAVDGWLAVELDDIQVDDLRCQLMPGEALIRPEDRFSGSKIIGPNAIY